VADTATPSGQADEGTQNEDWQSRYVGLQRVLSRKEAELAEARQAAEGRQGMVESDRAELAAVRAERAAADEERRAEQEYEALRGRFEPDPGTPMQHSESRVSPARDDRNYGLPWPV
jgi:predicted nuclease with TOPRIM domain